jgi:hypothetical protein
VQHMVRPGRGAPPPREPGCVLSWHTDSGASALHLSLTLDGARTLRLKRQRSRPLDAAAAALGADGVAMMFEEERLTLRSGDVYFSSPSAFQHAVHLLHGQGEEEEEEQEGAVAVQCRIAVPKHAMESLDRPAPRFSDASAHMVVGDSEAKGGNGGHQMLARIVAQHLASECYEYRLPSLREVLDCVIEPGNATVPSAGQQQRLPPESLHQGEAYRGIT